MNKIKKKKKPKTDQQLREAVRKKCVALAKEIAKIRDNYLCCYCGIGRKHFKQVHSHHIFHEGCHTGMSADVDNLITLCASHHQSFAGSSKQFSFHACPTESTEWLQNNYPAYKDLRKRSQKAIKVNWDKRLEELKEELDKLKETQ